MTRQMADDGTPSLYEAIAVFDKSASRTTPNAQTEAWTVIRVAVAALQAERDALRADVDGSAFVESTLENAAAAMTDLRKRAERAESALEAMRGQVTGLVKLASRHEGHDPQLRAALLAIKERMG